MEENAADVKNLHVYPSGSSLALISLGLGLAVFCLGLVSLYNVMIAFTNPVLTDVIASRTAPFLPQLSLRLQTISIRSTTLPGMVRHTF